MPKTYDGRGIEVSFDAARCIHAARCVAGLPEVFDVKRRPWIDPDRAPADRVAEVVASCPTGALTFRRIDGGADEVAPPGTSITEVVDGPLYVRGLVRVAGHDGQPISVGPRAALCRCGGTGNGPFCDGTHAKNGFQAPAA